MKRKIFYAVLLSCCVLGLSACAKSEEEQAADYYQEELGMNQEDAEELADYIYGDDSEVPSEEEENATAEVVATDEILSAEKYSNKVQIGNTVYEFPIKVSELIANGELQVQGPEHQPEININSFVEPGKEQLFNLVGNNIDLMFRARNDSDEITQLSNCVVGAYMDPYISDSINGLSISGYDSTDIILSGGVKSGMSYNELVEIYGEPDVTSVDDRPNRTGRLIHKYYDDMYHDEELCNPSYDYDSGYSSRTGYSYTIYMDANNEYIEYVSCVLGVSR